MDFLVSAAMLLVLLPFGVLVSIAIWVDSSGPVFFVQERVGKNLSRFRLLKFRTMTNQPRKIGSTPIIGRSEGVTRVGYYLRRYKIDELPQLYNVLKGDMSLVGPRPSVPDHLSNMNRDDIRRYSVRPGLTGVAQVSGNIHMPWQERFKLDLEYVDNICLHNDLRILCRTITVLIRGEGHYLGSPMRLRGSGR